jgi:hypothetical protein
MSFREKSAWISLLTMIAIYGFYFWSVIHAPHPGHIHFGGLLQTIIALVFVQVVLSIAVAIFKPGEAKAQRDERDQLIDLRATRVAYAGLATGVVVACFFGAFDPPIVFNTNALLFTLVAAEILRSAGQIVQYRRGA